MSRDEQRALVGEQEQSGQPAMVFCRERGIHYQSFLRWRKRTVAPVDAAPVGRAAFVELTVQPGPERPATQLAAELVLAGGMVLRVFAPSPARP